jgi:hypothetical protein
MDFYAPIKETSGLESTLRGIKQGVTLGFGDEITGALEAAFTNKSYRLARNEAREADYRAQKSNPLAYGAGELGGGVASAFIPGLGLAKSVGLAAKLGYGALAGKAALGAVTGAAAGLGASTAELMPEKISASSVKQAALDTGVGGLLGGGGAAAFHGLGKALGYAKDVVSPATKWAGSKLDDAGLEYAQEALAKAADKGDEAFKRAAKTWAPRVAADAAEAAAATTSPEAAETIARKSLADHAYDKMLEGSQYRTRIQAVGARGANEAAIRAELQRDPRLAQLASSSDKSPLKAAEYIDSVTEKLSRQNAKIYERASSAKGSVPLDDVIGNLRTLQEDYASTGARQKFAAAVDGVIEDLTKAHGKRGSIDPKKLREEITAWQERGYGGTSNMFLPGETKTMQREVSWAIREALHDHIAKAAATDPALANDLPALLANNQKISNLLAMGRIFDEKSTRAAAHAKPANQLFAELSLRSLLQKPTEVIGGAAYSGLEAGMKSAAARGQAAARSSSAAKIAREALEEVDALTPGSARVATSQGALELAALIRASQAAAKGGSRESVATQFARAIEAGVPRTVAERVVEAYAER